MAKKRRKTKTRKKTKRVTKTRKPVASWKKRAASKLDAAPVTTQTLSFKSMETLANYTSCHFRTVSLGLSRLSHTRLMHFDDVAVGIL